MNWLGLGGLEQEGRKGYCVSWRLAAGRGSGGWEFLLLKLTQPKSGEDRDQEEGYLSSADPLPRAKGSH